MSALLALAVFAGCSGDNSVAPGIPGDNFAIRGLKSIGPSEIVFCFDVSDTISDSMNDILHKNVEAGLTLKAGCGIGYEFSTLRRLAA